MARVPPKLSLYFTAQSLRDLDEIWDWNAKVHGHQHADRYISFLRAQTRRLTRSRNAGKEVSTNPDIRYLTIKQRARGYGHVGVCGVEGDTIHVFRYFHTSQDWESKIASDEP